MPMKQMVVLTLRAVIGATILFIVCSNAQIFRYSLHFARPRVFTMVKYNTYQNTLSYRGEIDMPHNNSDKIAESLMMLGQRQRNDSRSYNTVSFKQSRSPSTPIIPPSHISVTQQREARTFSYVKYVLKPKELCRGNVTLLVYIHSNILNSDRRQMLRSTWANAKLFKNRLVRFLYLTGSANNITLQRQLQIESSSNNDILQGEFIDHYKNLTYKGIMGLQWTHTHCSHARFILKTDDDVFVNTFGVLDLLNAQHPGPNAQHPGPNAQHPGPLQQATSNSTVICANWSRSLILRDRESCMKWCVDRDVLPGRKYYPNYCSGMAFILPVAIIGDLLSAFTVEPFLWIDDAFITGVLMRHAPNVRFKNILNKYDVMFSHAKEYVSGARAHLLFLHDIRHSSLDYFRVMWKITLTRYTNTPHK